MKETKQFEKDFGLLVETGFVAVKQSDEDSATKLFRAAQALKPEHTAPQIGFGYIALNKLELKEATTIFEAVIEKEPENYLGKTFLGLVLMMAKTEPERGHELVQEALKKSDDPSVHQFAQTALQWREKYFNKATASTTT